MEFFLLYMVYHIREMFNINLPTARYGTNHVDMNTKIESCAAHACWKQNKTIYYGDNAVHTQSRIFELHVLFNFVRYYW